MQTKKRASIIFITCLLLVLFLPLLSLTINNVQATITGTSPPASGDWIITQTTTVENEPNLIVNGSIIFNSAYHSPIYTFSVINSTITINGNFTATAWSNIYISGSTINLNVSGGTQFYVTGQTTQTYFNMTNSAIKNMTNDFNSMYLYVTTVKMNTCDLQGFGYQPSYTNGIRLRECFGVSLENINYQYVNGTFSVYSPNPKAITLYNFTSTNHELCYRNSSLTEGLLEIYNANASYLNRIRINATYAGIITDTTYSAGFDPFLYVSGDDVIINDFIVYCKLLTPHFPILISDDNVTVQNSYIYGGDNNIVTPYPSKTTYWNNITIDSGGDIAEAWSVTGGLTGWAIVSDSNIINSLGISLQSNLSVAFARCSFTTDNTTDIVAGLASGNLTLTNCTYSGYTTFALEYPDNPTGEGTAKMSQFWNFTDGTYIQLSCDEPTYQNANATLLPVTYQDKTVTYSLACYGNAPETLTTQVYCPLGEPYSVTGASSYSYDSGTQTLTVTSTDTASITVDYNFLSDAEESADTVFGNMYIAVGLVGVSLIVLACALIVKSLQSDIQDGLMFGVIMLIGSVVGLVVGFVIVARFESSMDNLLFLLSTLRKSCF